MAERDPEPLTGAGLPRLEALFDRLADLSEAEQAAALDAAERDDSDVAAAVRRLLARDRSGAEWIGRAVTAVAQTAPAPDPEPANRRIGPYRLVREIGRGGMGTVFEAEREDVFTKRVALKVATGAGYDADLARRFHEERQILARLEHPSIARLLDGGTTDDTLPYLVMEYVDGVPITANRRDARRAAGRTPAAVPAGMRSRPVRAREPRHPSRSEAGQHPRGGRTGALARLRDRHSDVTGGRARRPHRHRGCHARLLQPRAAARQRCHDAHRRLRARPGALRAADGRAGAAGRHALAARPRAVDLRDAGAGTERMGSRARRRRPGAAAAR